ncbi:hypothetical protein EMPS_07777 [Entomortierella parvispora]|uniref:Uncharacterized protein n=1 Tax=Entomortierella parvispora TaxID=205924 RepID=A0A9P3HEY0_9FUNG|nr:hypothetical protein EMPS_07777 [Entomortierella parvispora]
MSQPTPAQRFSLRKPVITGMECDEVPETPPSEPPPENQGFTPVKTKHTSVSRPSSLLTTQQATTTTRSERPAENVGDPFESTPVALSVHAIETDVRIACEEWGDVDHVIMGKNFKGRMSTATVAFTSADSTDTMLQSNPFMVIIGDDSGQIKRYGNHIVDHTHNIRQKLVNLPQGSTPRTVVTMFQDAGYEFATITMPVTVLFGRRFLEAFLTFTDEEQWDKVSGEQ